MGILQPGKVQKRIEEYNLTHLGDQIEITGNQVAPVGKYNYFYRNVNTIKFSGFGSRDEEGRAINGRIGNNPDEKTLEYGQKAARGACLNFINNLATVCLGDLDGVTSIAFRVDINCNPDFKALPSVANGASELLAQVFGSYIGTPTRTAAGSSSLPNDMTVEVSGEVVITDQLAQKLDVYDAKKLLGVLDWAQGLMNSEYDFSKPIGDALENAKKLSKPLHAQLQKYVKATSSALEKSNINIEAKQWTEFATSLGVSGNVASKENLIELIEGKGQQLKLTLDDAKLSKHANRFYIQNSQSPTNETTSNFRLSQKQ